MKHSKNNAGEARITQQEQETEIMFVMGNLIVAIARILDIALTLYMWVIIASALISWVNPDPYNPIVRFLHRVTEPVLERVRRWLPIRGMGIDISPIVVILIIYFLQWFLVRTMIDFAVMVH